MLRRVMSVRRIIEAFEQWRQRGEPLVLATVYDTLGSTYTKPGHRILIAANGDYQGLVSGGCVEGDLAERARAAAESARPGAVTYDLRDDADDLWGLGVGCNGLLRVFLQPLTAAGGYQPFTSIAARLLGKTPSAVATVIASPYAAAPVGGTLLMQAADRAGAAAAFAKDPVGTAAANDTTGTAPAGGGDIHSIETHAIDRGDAVIGTLVEGCRRALTTGRPEHVRDADGLEVLYAPLMPVPRVLVLGAGLDAVPVVAFAADLGWRVTVADHRPAYLSRGGFAKADRVVEVDPAELPQQVALDSFAAILVMSHHLETDRIYLSHLVRSPARYLGVLGPPARRARLLDGLGAEGEILRPRLRGPIGLDIGADSPESIALSIVAELQAVFVGRTLR